MGYQALLYCPEEKTARTLTQVLTDLEFAVEPCAEPFAAVKKLMSEHFDAVVVDCDNEQNATLLFKSARNSTSNQASLAVAVVEGQAGVAKAFRIGANLVLTKPINVEQAKGTLRVARGLLRKGDAAKPAAGVPPAAPVPRSSAPPAPKAPVVPNVVPPSAVPASMASGRSNVSPSAGQNAFVDSAAAGEKEKDKKAAVPAPQVAKPAFPPATLVEAVSSMNIAAAAKPASFGSAAASAPAPARDILEVPPSHRPLGPAGEDDNILESASGEQRALAAAAHQAPAPDFSFGGANAPAGAAIGSKKAILGVAAVVLVGVLAYAGWAHFSSHTTSTASSTAPGTAPASQSPAFQPKPAQPGPASAPANPPSSVASSPSTTLPASAAKSGGQTLSVSPAATPPSHAESSPDEGSSETATSAKSSSEEESKASPNLGETPLVVKSGTVPKIKAKAAASAVDAPAPSVIGMADPAANDSLSNLVDSGSGPKPVLQKMNVSQGVSTGLLIKRVDPIYPPNAVRMRIEGSVLLDATISKTGNITGVKVVNGDSQLARAATDAVKKWKYAPYLLNGEPVEIQTQITIRFKLPS